MPKNNSKAQREFRKSEAETRQAARKTRTAGQQLQALLSRPGEALKETRRLLPQAEKEARLKRLDADAEADGTGGAPKRVRSRKPKAE